MPLTRMIPEEEATGKVKEIYDDIKRTRKLAKVPNYWKTLAADPDYLEVTWNRQKVIMRPGKLDALTKEIVALAVSATNNCDYCIRSHLDACRALGLDEQGLLEVMAVVDFFNGSNATASGLKIEYEPPVRAAD